MSDYVKNKDGNITLSNEAARSRTFSYLRDLYPMEWIEHPKHMKKIVDIVNNKIDLNKPTIFIYRDDIHKSVFSSILAVINKYVYWTQTSIDHGTQNYLSGEYHDASSEFDGYEVLFVTMNFGETKNILHPQLARNYAMNRKMKGLKTFFFFWGNYSQLKSSKWMIDDDGSGKTGEFLDKYCSIVNLGEVFTDNKNSKGE